MTAAQPGRHPENKVNHVCIVTSTFPRWVGDTVPHFVLELASDIAASGWQVVVLAPHFKGALAHEEMNGVSVSRFRYMWPAGLETLAYGDGGAMHSLRRKPWNAIKIPFYFLAQVVSLYRLVRSRRIDVINSHWLLPQGLAAAIVSRITRVVHVATVHGGDVLGLTSAGFLRAKQMALKECSACTVNSSVTETAVRALADPSLRIERISLGVNPFRPVAPDVVKSVRDQYDHNGNILLLFTGRLIPQKGCGDLLVALKQVSLSHPNIRLLIAGDGPERGSLEATSANLGIADHVEFLGWVQSDQLALLYQAVDLFVAAPTRGPGGETEAFGLVFVEAALAGLPTVATRSGGISDVIIDGETGLLVAENDPEALARAILDLLSDAGKARRMGETARKRAESKFTRAQAATSFAELFTEISGRQTR